MKSISAAVAAVLVTMGAASAQTPAHEAPGSHGGVSVQSGHGGVNIQAGSTGYTGDHGAIVRQHATSQHYQSYQDTGFRAEIGGTLPGAAALHPLPDGVVTGVPSARGHQYSIVNDRYVVVDPSNRRIIHTFD